MAITKEWLEEQITALKQQEHSLVIRHRDAWQSRRQAETAMTEAAAQLQSVRVVRRELQWQLTNLREKEVNRQ